MEIEIMYNYELKMFHEKNSWIEAFDIMNEWTRCKFFMDKTRFVWILLSLPFSRAVQTQKYYVNARFRDDKIPTASTQVNLLSTLSFLFLSSV